MEFPRKVYAIKHNKTGRIYIGSSSNLDRRIKHHMAALRRHAHTVEDMQADYDKYGEDYTLSILEEIFEYKDRKKEYEWMGKYQSNIRGIGYNYKDSVWNKRTGKREKKMSQNERKLINIIQQSDNPEQTVLLAIKIFSSFV